MSAVLRTLLSALLGLILGLGLATPIVAESETETAVSFLAGDRSARLEAASPRSPARLLTDRDSASLFPSFVPSAVSPYASVRIHVVNCCWRK